ncbi:hypothetical protein, partial [Sandarakinorhabdus sp.]|uniref:hypothetical protein n=1 Tax=Sandarakinorhabdus sp. TaxID=1916663 RepID=UPI00333FD531
MLKAQEAAGGIVLDRVVGPGWADTPGNLLDHLIKGRHEFVLENTNLRLAAQRHAGNTWMLQVVDEAGQPQAAERLPHWRVERYRAPKPTRMNWFQR